MRPVRLRLQGFGAFPATETVEFDELARLGLFLVSGPTGAGKTTLLDALAFALYGDLPAGRPLGEVRSHHALPGERCEVELDFTVEDGTFRVRRSPEQERPKRRGTGVTVDAATAELHRLEPDGSEVPVASGTRPVTDRCVQLVGLDAGQFERVVLLPQGRFQRFLLADTKDRRPLLQKLFGTALFRDAVDELKRRAGELRRQVAEVDAEVARHRLNAREHLRTVAAGLADPSLDGVDPDDDVELLAAFWEKLVPVVDEVGRDADELAARAAEAVGTARAAAATAERWDRRAVLRRQHQRLLAEEAEIDRVRQAAAEAARAAPVVTAGRSLERAEAALARAGRVVDRATEALVGALRALDLAPDGGPGEEHPGDAEVPLDVDGADRALGVATAELERCAALLRELAAVRLTVARRRGEQAEAAADLERVLEDQRRLREDAAGIKARQAELEPVAAAGPAASARVAITERRLTGRRRLDRRREELEAATASHDTAEAELAEVLARFVEGAAPRLAASLRPGEGCPVCGSEQHPAPATGGGRPGPELAEVEAAQQRATARSSAVASARRALEELVADLGPDAGRPVTALEEEHAVAAAEARAADAAVAELEQLRGRADLGAGRLASLQTDAERLGAARAAAEAAAAAASERAEELAEAVGDADAAGLTARGRSLAAASAAVEAYRRADAERSSAEGACVEARAGLDEALGASGIAELSAARAVALDDAARRDAERRVARHDAATVQVRGGLDALDDDDLPEERPDAESLVASATELRTRAEGERARVERLLERGEAAQQAIAAARRTDDAATGLRDVHERTERVAALCDGQGPGRIGLEAWVLAGELERVTAAANVHLGRMSNGRYQLRRTDDAGHRAKQAGLDLSVFDSHTGRSRAPATLSGGEQFQASLALALGLADVVSLGGSGSGRRFEALFVDEGFGSLDPVALDQAVEALHQIHASGRMVGVVTHVEAMKQQLPTGIEVHRRPDGRGSTLTAPDASTAA